MTKIMSAPPPLAALGFPVKIVNCFFTLTKKPQTTSVNITYLSAEELPTVYFWGGNCGFRHISPGSGPDCTFNLKTMKI